MADEPKRPDDEREETISDLEVPDEQAEEVSGGHEGFKVGADRAAMIDKT
jgi:hypothetical protein